MSTDVYRDGADPGALVIYQLDPNAMDYLYVQMAEHLSERIIAGELTVNSILPSEVRLARQYGVSLGTGRKATELLRTRGLVMTLQSKGSFVIARPDTATSRETAEDEPETGRLAWVQNLDQ